MRTVRGIAIGCYPKVIICIQNCNYYKEKGPIPKSEVTKCSDLYIFLIEAKKAVSMLMTLLFYAEISIEYGRNVREKTMQLKELFECHLEQSY